MYRRFLMTALLIAPLAGLVSCLFDATADSSSKSEWFENNGFPTAYKVKTLALDSLLPRVSAVGFDSTPVVQTYRAALGGASGVEQNLLLDFGFRDSVFLAKCRATGVAGAAVLRLYTDSTFYNDLQKASLPIADSLQLRLSWKLDKGRGSAFVDSVGDVTDSAWVTTWRSNNVVSDSADTSMVLNITAIRDSFDIPLPAALRETIFSVTDAMHLQLRVSVVNPPRILRVRSTKWSYSEPLIKLTADTLSKAYDAYRMAQQSRVVESECAGCLVLHGGIRESLLVEFDAQPILKALSDFYGDGFPNVQNGDSLMDVRQAVVMAQIAVGRDSSTLGSELGYPVPVFAASLIDSLKGDGSYWQYTEGYKLDTNSIKTKGHPNLLYFPGDSLSLQITGALRRFINTAATLPSPTFRVVLRMGRPMLAPYDLYYYDHTNSDGNAVQIFADNMAFNRYDFAKAFAAGAPVRLKLWLASTREAGQ